MPTDDHDIGTRLHRDPITGYDLGTEGYCTCGWVGPLRDLLRRGQAFIDANKHRIDTKETAA